MAFEREFVPGHELPAIARAANRDGLGGFFLHADSHGALVVLEYLLQIRGLLAAAAVDAVKPASVAAWVLVDFEAIVGRQLQLVRHLPDFDRFKSWAFGVEMLVRQFE